MKTVFIYVLKEPDTGKIRYVGKSVKPSRRLRQHCCHARTRNKNYHINNWINLLLERRVTPSLEIIDEVPEVEWKSWEASYIEYFRECGCELVNSTPGGDGRGRGWNHTDAAKLKMSLATMGEKNSNFGKTGGLSPRFGVPLSVECKLKISASLSGRFAGVNHPLFGKRGELSPNFGRKNSEKTRLKMSESAKLREEKKRQEAVLAEMWR